MTVRETYEQWRERMESEGVPDPPVIFAGNWARKRIEELEAEVERLGDALTRIMLASNGELIEHPEKIRAVARLALARKDPS